MKLQVKISILLSILFGVIIFTFLIFQYIRIKEKELLSLENIKNQELVIDKVMELNRVKYDQLINDNSSWDEMVNFAAEPDTVWAKDNVDFFVSSFKLSFVKVYNEAGNLIYQHGDSNYLSQQELTGEFKIKPLFAQSTFAHFFQYCGKDLFEVFGATIVPASDANIRKSPALGYLFIGQKWDPKYIAAHGQATNFSVEVIPASEISRFSRNPRKNYLTRDLLNQNGQPVARLVFSRQDPLKSEMSVFLVLSVLLTLTSIAAIIIFLHYFRSLILKPLSLISKTLKTRNTGHLIAFDCNVNEFNKIKSLILQFFYQEELLKKSNSELKEINSTKDKLFSIIAHDLKNPIGNISAISNLLSESIKNNDRETTDELLSMIGSQTKETSALLETLFDWAKSQTGQFSFNPTKHHLKDITVRVIEIHQPAAVLKKITIKSIIPDDIMVFADLNMLKTILRNLTSNAIKFTYPGGLIQISAEQKPNGTEVIISDNGIGMNKDTLQSLFQIDNSRTTRGTADEKGTGLGLIICKEFIEKHGGNIRAESEKEKGTRFIFFLPDSSH
jgi:signal transduction histidine kinase